MFRKILQILDGKPAAVRGQSLVEMAFTTPILLLMILSLAEIGFVANNYLILMDVTREAARRGANLNPTLWDNDDTRNFERMDCDLTAGWFSLADNSPQNRRIPRGYGILDNLANLPNSAGNLYKGYPSYAYDGPFTGAYQLENGYGFFDSVACQALLSMEPLTIEDTGPWINSGVNPPGYSGDITQTDQYKYFNKNEIVISAVSFAKMDYNDSTDSTWVIGDKLTPSGGTRGAFIPANGTFVTVTGRYPKENRKCGTAPTSGQLSDRMNRIYGDYRDPFHYTRSYFYTNWSDDPLVRDQVYEDLNIVGDTVNQDVRGFVFTGQQRDASTGCFGSTFRIQDIESVLNQQYTSDTISKAMPNGGMVIVEIWWQHHPIFLGPLFQGFQAGNTQNDPVLYLYSLFPSIGAEPTSTPDE